MTAHQEKEPLQVSDLLLLTVTQLIQKAWAFLGTIRHPETGTQQQDLNQARLAIDATEALLPLLKGADLPGDTLKDLEFQLANLRINYLALQEKARKTTPTAGS